MVGSAIEGEDQTYIPVILHRLPGFTAWLPDLQSGHPSAGNAGTSRVARAALGTPSLALPPLRSINVPVAKTTPPARSTTSMVSRVDPPAVTTSSTTTHFSPGSIRNP